MNQLLVNASIVLTDGIAQNQLLTITDGRISKISERASDSDAGRTDLSGLFLYPGLIDVHIHGAVGIDVLDASVSDLQTVSRFLLQNGVTAWLPTLVPAPADHYQRAIDNISEAMNEGGTDGARILGVHYEGPFVSELQCGALHGEYFKTFADATVLDSLPTVPAKNAVHMITVAPEIDGGIDLVAELTQRGWIVSIGHTRADLDTLNRALEAGARHMTHFMNAMPPLHHRNPGPVGWGLMRDDVSCDVIADGIHLDPVVLRLLLQVKTVDRLALISDSIAAAGKGNGDYEIWGETISVQNGRTANRHGSIAGSVITMLDAVRMMRSLGASDVEVARMASTNPARLLRLDNDCGSIGVGKRADLVALDQHGQVRFAMVNGRGCWS